MIAPDLTHAKVGDVLPEVTFGPVTRATLALYAGASGDHNPIHIDSDFAKQAGMNDVFAHGMLSMAVAARLITNWAKIERVKSIGVRFQSLTFVGDEIVCSGKVSDVFEEAGERLLRIDISARTRPETVTLVGQAIVIAN